MDAKQLIQLSKNIHNFDRGALPATAEKLRNAYSEIKQDLNTLGNTLLNIATNIMKINEVKEELVPYYEQIIDDIILSSI